MKKTKKPTRRARTMTIVVPPHLGWAASRYNCTLRLHKSVLINNATGMAANVRFEPTYAYDVDPTVGSTAMPGFTELAGIYRLYRVQHATIRVSFSNIETFPVVAYICPVNTDPGANYSTTVAQQYLANLLSRRRSLGPTTGEGVCDLVDRQSTKYFAGANDPKIVDTYCGSTNGGTVPTNNWYWTVGVISSAAMVSGVYADVYVDINLDFFEVLSPAS
jgi:hypothetical protein